MTGLRRFMEFLFRRSKGTVLLMVCLGAASGVLSAAALAYLNEALRQATPPSIIAGLVFACLVAAKIGAGMWTQLLMVRFTQDTILDLSISLCAQLVRVPLRRIEERGAGNILVTLTDDVGSVTWAIQCLPQLAMNATVLLGCGLYLFWLSWQVLVGLIVATLLGALGYQRLHAGAFHVIHAAREARAGLFRRFRALTEGIKELLMHRARSCEFVEQEIRGAAETYRQTNLDATRRYALADAWTQGSFFLLVGTIVFLYPQVVSLPMDVVLGYVVVILYMMNPVWNIIGTVPALTRGQVALENIDRLGVSLASDLSASRQQEDGLDVRSRPPVISFEQVTFAYGPTKERDEGFTLGPLTVEIASGELVFVIGGNGSGKSTFVKLITGLYEPCRGTIKLGDVSIGHMNQTWYREHFSAVFADFYLFDKLLGIHDPRALALAKSYLVLLQMEHKVDVRDRTFTTIDLSQGQRKRLALITAYLEDRPIYVFDEWAADQDPQYKEVFYRKLLPDLRARGKTVIVITHDDRYFHLGDQVIKLEDGKIAQVQRAGSGRSSIAAGG